MPIANNRVTVLCGTNTVGTQLTASTLVGNVVNPIPVTVYNPGAAPVFLGGPNVTLANGVALAPGATLSYPIVNGDVLYGVCSTATTTVNLMVGQQ